MEEKVPSEKAELIQDVVGFSFHKLWTTFKELTLRPGQMVGAYCDGNRSKYVSPVTYFLLAFGLWFFIASFPGILPVTKTTGKGLLEFFTTGFRLVNPDISSERIKALYDSAELIEKSKEARIISRLLGLILFQWLFFRTYRKRFLPHLYFSLFVLAQIDFLSLPLFIPVFFDPSFIRITMSVVPVVGAAVYLYAALNFYPGLTIISLVLRAAGLYVAGFIFFFLSYFIVMGVSMAIMSLFI